MKISSKLASIMALNIMVTASANSYAREERTRPNTSNIGGGYAHEGIYSQSKKLRKGAGHKKLTRAQRKRGNRHV